MLTLVSEVVFNETDPIFRVVVHDHSRKFGLLQLPRASHPLAVAWRGDLIDPVIVTDHRVVWLGVDQRVVCVTHNGSTLFSIGLNSSLMQIKIAEKFTLVLCETQAIAINHDYTLRTVCDFAEVADEVDVRDDKLVVTFIDGESRTFSV